MKFTEVALIVALGLVALSVNASAENKQIEFELTQDYKSTAQELAEELLEIESQSFSSGIFAVLRKVLNIYTELNSTIDGVTAIHDAAHDLVKGVTQCDTKLSEKALLLIYACNNIHETCKYIIGLKGCLQMSTEEEEEILSRQRNFISNDKSPQSCFMNILLKLLSLREQTMRAAVLIKEILEISRDNDCVIGSIDNFGRHLIQ